MSEGIFSIYIQYTGWLVVVPAVAWLIIGVIALLKVEPANVAEVLRALFRRE